MLKTCPQPEKYILFYVYSYPHVSYCLFYFIFIKAIPYVKHHWHRTSTWHTSTVLRNFFSLQQYTHRRQPHRIQIMMTTQPQQQAVVTLSYPLPLAANQHYKTDQLPPQANGTLSIQPTTMANHYVIMDKIRQYMSLNIITNCTHVPISFVNEISTPIYSHWHRWLYYIILYYIILYYIILYYIILYYITLHYITLHYITLHYITLHYITLHYIIWYYIISYIISYHTILYTFSDNCIQPDDGQIRNDRNM